MEALPHRGSGRSGPQVQADTDSPGRRLRPPARRGGAPRSGRPLAGPAEATLSRAVSRSPGWGQAGRPPPDPARSESGPGPRAARRRLVYDFSEPGPGHGTATAGRHGGTPAPAVRSRRLRPACTAAAVFSAGPLGRACGAEPGPCPSAPLPPGTAPVDPATTDTSNTRTHWPRQRLEPDLNLYTYGYTAAPAAPPHTRLANPANPAGPPQLLGRRTP